MTTFSPDSRAILKTSMGDITLEFLVSKAPRTCEHFVRLARRGFYDGLTFHRIIKGFMVQGGCPKGDGTGGPGQTLRAEFNDTPHVKGVVSMARGNDPHSAGSQFFIVQGEARYLDSRYTAFARVVDGLPVLERIASVPVQENKYRERSAPLEPVFINSIVLEGIEFDANDHNGPQDAGRGPQGGNSAQGQSPPQQGQHHGPAAGHGQSPAPQSQQAPQAGQHPPGGGPGSGHGGGHGSGQGQGQGQSPQASSPATAGTGRPAGQEARSPGRAFLERAPDDAAEDASAPEAAGEEPASGDEGGEEGQDLGDAARSPDAPGPDAPAVPRTGSKRRKGRTSHRGRRPKGNA